MKTCKGCGHAKDLSCFHRNGKRGTGHRGKCKQCIADAYAEELRTGGNRPAYAPAPYADDYNAWLRVKGAERAPITWTIRRAA